MDSLHLILALATMAFGAAAVWLAIRLVGAGSIAAAARAERDGVAAEAERYREEARAFGERSQTLGNEVATLREKLLSATREYETQLKGVEQLRERLELDHRARLKELNDKFEATFKSLATDALKNSGEAFLKLAKATLETDREKASAELEKRKTAVDELIKPMGETLRRTEEKLTGLAAASGDLRLETSKLVRALREPHVRGRYGEVQLRRVAELAGMSAYCDFSEQDRTIDSDGNALRPDMIVRLPSERVVVVDAKTNIQAYLDALQAGTHDEQEACLDRFARHVAEQATALARKKYWTQYEGSPEFVVMFIPGDSFIDAALARQPELLEQAARQNVLLAGPATLIGLLRAVAVGYKEQRLAKAAEELRELGVELHKRAADAFAHIAQLGAALDAAVDRYNSFVGSYQRRLEPHLRKFEEAGDKSPKDLPELPEVTVRARLDTGAPADTAD